MKFNFFAVIILSVTFLSAAAANTQTRTYTVNAAQKIFSDKQKSPMERRTAFRVLTANPATREKTLQQGVADNDAVICSRSLYLLFHDKGDGAFPAMKKAAVSQDPMILEILYSCASQMKDMNKRTEIMRLIAANPTRCHARSQAAKIVSFNFYRENKRLKDDPAYDHDLVIAKSIMLPLKGWSFALDPENAGHKQGWYIPQIEVSDWRKLNIGYWEEQGIPKYDGIAWYRINFKMPKKMSHAAVELHFQAVDEGAWVWLNGKYIGQHDIGTDGWDKPFWLDVTKEIQWDAENTLAVRVEDTIYGGGIWKPVSVEILK